MEQKASKSELYLKQREEIVKKDRKDYFCVDVPSLTEEEKKADESFLKIKEELLSDGKMPFLDNYYKSFPVISSSKLFKSLHKMPKGAHLHLHMTAASRIDFLMEIAKEDCVYYNESLNLCKVFVENEPEEGYKKCSEIRENWDKEGTFDDFLQDKILLNEEDVSSKHSNTIWSKFQPKFDVTFDLYNYEKFFERILYQVMIDHIEEKCFILEFRHIFGCIFNDKHEVISLEDELALFNRCIEKVKEVEPSFSLKLISCGLKIVGEGHINSQLKSCIEGLKKTKIIAGFDLVCEEEITPPLLTFQNLIRLAQEDEETPVNVYLHAGETSSRFGENVYDAVILGTKRIGHGFAIQNHPHLIEIAKENEICLEVCPLSNLILGYTYDLRWHPARSLMYRGVPLTISADDPGFWKSHGTTLDYCYIALAWELTLKELKQFAINGIKHAALNDTEREKQREKFDEEWTKWIEHLNSQE
ncbi:unnamed protein product [Moneuplotes crassus]|uniref:Adenosine deaminase domain-containing protein n=3 Tax=Euplotes crassus TaxID=5936 RepID=A0AAD1UI06_EUPCR|nr:unnamed protein product [Moneuplotes crassus]